MEIARRKGFVFRLWFAVAAAGVVVALLLAIALDANRVRDEELAQLEASAAARVVAAAAEGVLAQAGVALFAASQSWERHRRGETDFAEAARQVERIRGAVTGLSAILITGASGVVVDGAGPAPRSAGPLGDRPYFARLRAAAGDAGTVEGPFADPGIGAIVLARALRGPTGEFDGVALAAIGADRMSRLLPEGTAGEVTLFGADFQVLARNAPGMAGSGIAEALRGAIDAGRQDGLLAGADRAVAEVAFRRVGAYAAWVTVKGAGGKLMRHWHGDSVVLSLMAILLAAVFAGTGAMVHRAWRAQQADAERLAHMASTDPLTGLPNRRAFFDEADAERARAVRYGPPMAVLMLDIDHFKRVNDTHGHQAGDLVLQHLGLTCDKVLREVDVLGRVGGEEFAILLPQTGLVAAAEVAERLRAAVEQDSVPRPDGAPLRITISIGVAALQGAESLDTLVSRADTALYQAKRAGRNRVRILPDGEAEPPA